jgi:hypothetical protein
LLQIAVTAFPSAQQERGDVIAGTHPLVIASSIDDLGRLDDLARFSLPMPKLIGPFCVAVLQCYSVAALQDNGIMKFSYDRKPSCYVGLAECIPVLFLGAN